MTGFRIETARVLVREWMPADWEPFRAIATDRQVMRYIGDGSPWSDAQLHGFIARQRESARQHGFCLGPLLESASQDLIGQAGLQYLGTTGNVEIGWWLAPRWWGRGMGTEVGRAVLRFAFEVAQLPRVVAIAHPQNLASIRIMQTIGMMFRGVVLRSQLGLGGRDMEIVLYSAERRSDGRRVRPGAVRQAQEKEARLSAAPSRAQAAGNRPRRRPPHVTQSRRT